MGFIRKLICKMDLPKFNLPDFSKFTIPSHLLGTQSILGSIKQPNMEMRDGEMISVETLSNKEFLEKLNSQQDYVQIGEETKVTRVVGLIEINTSNWKKKFSLFENLEFEQTVIFQGNSLKSLLNIGESIVFLNCRFESKIIFKHCKSPDYKQNNEIQQPKAIQFSGGWCNELNITDCNFPSGLLFNNAEGKETVINWLEINNCKFNSEIRFEKAQIHTMCDINFNRFTSGGISFNNSEISSGLRLTFNIGTYNNIYLRENEFKKQIFIYGGEYNRINIEDCKLKEKIDLLINDIKEEVLLKNNTFEERFHIDCKDQSNNSISSKSPNEIWIQNNKFLNGFYYNFEFLKVANITLIFSEKSSGVIDLENGCFEEIDIVGNNFNNSTFFRDCKFVNLRLINFFNRALLSFNNNNPQIEHKNSPIEFLIQNSNLGNTEFYDFDFSIYPTTRIIDSRLDNIFFNGVEWFEPDQLQVDESENDQKKILSQKREIYRQLKLAAEKQSDRITALEFKAREVETHNRLLGKEKFLSRKWWSQVGDRAAISVGTTNNHGQNWIKPLLLILGITTVFFPLLFVLADPGISFRPNWTAQGGNFFLSKVCEHGAAWPQLFNPTRRVSDLFEEIAQPFWFYFLDGFHRIVLAFFIFQIVSAFRKFVK
jgi:hypothetical protein